METIELNNGVLMPRMGLGTFPLNGYNLIKTMMLARLSGYNAFDTSVAYGNESYVGKGIKLIGKRKDIFITTKISNRQQRECTVEEAVKSSLKALKTDYIDLYLMHWPNPETFLDTWTGMEKVYKEGLVRAIGVCNFHQHHIEELMKVATVTPAVNQVEIHPLLSQKELIKYCKSKGIVMEAYTPLARMDERLFKNDVINRIAKKYNKTVGQVVLRWDYQQDIIVIPKTSKYKRLKENIDIFDFSLSDEEMKKIDEINMNLRLRHDPDNCDFSKL